MTAPDTPQPVPGDPGDDHRRELVREQAGVRAFVLSRLRASPVLSLCMAAAFLCYGALVLLTLWHRGGEPIMPIQIAGMLMILSLASWFFLFWWFPVLERTLKALEGGRRAWIPVALEVIATGCVVVVHLLMVGIILKQAMGGS